MKGNRTLAIFGAAAMLVLAALVYQVTQNRGYAVPPTPPVTPPTVTPVAPTVNPTASGKVGQTLVMTGRLSSSHLLKGTGSEEAFLLVDVDATDDTLNKRVPLDVAIVIDRSGSMIGDKLIDAKRAAKALIGKFSRGDRVTLVSYSTNVTIEVPLTDAVEGAQSFYNAIDALTAVGGTHISGGLQTGRQLLQGSGGGHRVRRIILLSDGHATAGLTEVHELARIATESRNAGVTVTSMGLGVDYNERAMTQIANQGGGNYYFIEKSSNLASTFDKELGTLTTSVARDTLLNIELAEGVVVERVFGFSHTINGRRIQVPMSEFHAGQNKSLLVQIKVAQAPRDLVSVASLQLSYLDLLRDAPVNHSLGLSMASTTDMAKVTSSRDREVFVRREQIMTANAYDAAMERFESGDKSAAQRILNVRNDEMRKNNKWLKSAKLSDEARNADTVIGDLDRVQAASPKGKASIKANRARSNKMFFVR